MTRQSNSMKKLNGHRLPQRIIFFDCETWPDAHESEIPLEIHRFRLGVAMEYQCRHGRYVRQDTLHTTDSMHLRHWIIGKAVQEYDTWVMAHNLTFDFTVSDFWSEFRTGNLVLDVGHKNTPSDDGDDDPGGGVDRSLLPLIVDDPPIVIPARCRDGRRLVFVDSLNYYRTSLAKLGQMVGMRKLAMPQWGDGEEAWFRYCENDVLVLAEAMLRLIEWWRQNEYGSFKFTTPSLAMTAYRTRFMPRGLAIPDDEDIRRLERLAYYGGRTQAFRLGVVAGDVVKIDVVSMYPSVMRDNPYPVRVIDHCLTDSFDATPPPVPLEQCVARVRVKVGEDCLPVRTRRGIVYPIGEIDGVFAGPELRLIEALGYEYELGAWVAYELDYIFREYVDHFYRMKQMADDACDDVTRSFAKLLLNSLYGKFGQRGSRWEVIKGYPPYRDYGKIYDVTDENGEVTHLLSWPPYVFHRIESDDSRYAWPAIAAFVTSYARVRLHEDMMLVGRENVLYCSTDSMIVSAAGYERLASEEDICSGTLGTWKVEKTGTECEIRGLHWYRIGDEWVVGCIKRSAVQLNDTTWEELVFQNLAGVMASGCRPCIVVKPTLKQKFPGYFGRCFYPDGRSRPWHSAELTGELTPLPIVL